MKETPLRVRFAPSPTGSLHLGNARTALFNWLVARHTGGKLILRIEDTDTERHVEGSEEEILADLAWLGLDWDEGPDTGGECGPYRQSERRDRHDQAIESLLESGKAYRCFCTDEEIAREREERKARGDDPRYSGRCGKIGREESERRMLAGEPHAVRFRTLGQGAGQGERTVRFRDRLRGMLEFSTSELGDPVLRRRDGRPTYNFAVVVDDAEMKIDLVLRGDDHLSNTPRQVLLFDALGSPLPEFAHLPMVRGVDGERLSKRHGAVAVSDYRRRGASVGGMVNALVLLGWAPHGDRTLVNVDEMVREFDLDRVSHSPSIFDPVKLNYLSNQHFQRTPAEELAEMVGRRLATGRLIPEEWPEGAGEWLTELAGLMRVGIEYLDQVPRAAATLFSKGGMPEEADAREMLEEDSASAVLQALSQVAADQPPQDTEAWRALKKEVRERAGVKGKALFHPMRVAITGRASGPELDRLVPLIVKGNRLFPGHITGLSDRVRRTMESL